MKKMKVLAKAAGTTTITTQKGNVITIEAELESFGPEGESYYDDTGKISVYMGGECIATVGRWNYTVADEVFRIGERYSPSTEVPGYVCSTSLLECDIDLDTANTLRGFFKGIEKTATPVRGIINARKIKEEADILFGRVKEETE